jgi:hypothetical protein
MRAPAYWALGGLTSLTAHGAAAIALLWVIQPATVQDQPPPETRLNMTTYQVETTQAQENTPDIAEADQSDAKGKAVQPDSLRVQKSQSLRVDTVTTSATDVAQTPVVAVAATGDVVRDTSDQQQQQAVETLALSLAIAPQDIALMADSALQATSVQTLGQTAPSVKPPADTAVFVAPQADQAPALLAAGDRALPVITVALTLPVARPALQSAPSAPLAAAQVLPRIPDATPLAEDTPAITALADRVIQSPNSAALELPAQHAQAALAFAGAGNGPVDPVSLAAFQSFMQPDDLNAASENLRDSMRNVMDAVPCSRLQVMFRPEDNALVLSGHVPQDGLRGTVLKAMQDQMGSDIPVIDNLLILPRPQCGALTGISQVGLPQSTDQITNPLLLGKDTHARVFSYVAKQPMVLDLQGADYDAYIYVDFFDAGGNVLHLAPNEYTALDLTPAKAALRIGAAQVLAPGEPGLYLEIGPPYGQEIAVAFAASQPLYEGIRPLVEPAEPYLNWLQSQVAKAREAKADFKGEWVYFFISTSAE